MVLKRKSEDVLCRKVTQRYEMTRQEALTQKEGQEGSPGAVYIEARSEDGAEVGQARWGEVGGR